MPREHLVREQHIAHQIRNDMPGPRVLPPHGVVERVWVQRASARLETVERQRCEQTGMIIEQTEMMKEQTGTSVGNKYLG